MAFPTGWTRYAAVTTPSAKVDSDQAGFPVLVGLSDTGLTAARSDRGDVRFSSDTTGATQLPADYLGQWDDTKDSNTPKSWWVVLRDLSSSVDTAIYAWWGNASATLPVASDTHGGQNAYDANVLAYLPMREDPSGSAPQMLDRTSNSNDATTSGSMTSGDSVAGINGTALDFDGADDGLVFTSTGPTVTSNSPRTYE